jgi:hypothetical protein
VLLVLLQGKDESGKPVTDYWKPSLGLLADKDLIGKLKSYDKDNIPPKWVMVADVTPVLVLLPSVCTLADVAADSGSRDHCSAGIGASAQHSYSGRMWVAAGSWRQFVLRT